MRSTSEGMSAVTTIKASCPTCGEVELTSDDVSLMVCSQPTLSYYAFTCPGCLDEVRKPASAVFVPTYGWPILFQVGGIVPIVIGIAAIFGLPESIKYMALHESQRGNMEKLVAEIRPDLKVPPDARFVVEPGSRLWVGGASETAPPSAALTTARSRER